MLNVTTEACRFLAEKTAQLQASEGEVMRVFASGEGLALKLGPIQADDRTVIHQDKPILAIAASVSEAAHDRILDVVASSHGPKLKVSQRALSEPEIRPANLRRASRSAASGGCDETTSSSLRAK